MAEKKPPVKFDPNLQLTLVIDTHQYYENEHTKEDKSWKTFGYYVIEDDVKKVLYASEPLQQELVNQGVGKGAVVDITQRVKDKNTTWEVEVTASGGDPCRSANGATTTPRDSGDSNGNEESTSSDNGNGQQSNNGQRQSYGRYRPGTAAGDEAVFVESLASAYKVFQHPSTQLIWNRLDLGPPTEEMLFHLAMHFSKNRQDRGEREPQDGRFSSPPPEGVWDEALAALREDATE
jgi:hypothetical protein